MYGFSLFKMSTQRVGILNYNPPASRVVTHCYTQKSPFRTIIEVSSHYLRFMAKKTNDLSHTKWMCKYHIVFTPKYSVSCFMGYLKGKSTLMLFDRHAN